MDDWENEMFSLRTTPLFRIVDWPSGLPIGFIAELRDDLRAMPSQYGGNNLFSGKDDDIKPPENQNDGMKVSGSERRKDYRELLKMLKMIG